MDELIFDVTVDGRGRYLAEARGNGVCAEGASFEEMKAEAIVRAKAYFTAGDSVPKIIRVGFEEVLKLA